ncbi:MAG: CPBP family intramembrane metalloprotease [Bacteroidetes bacterium]|nr:CPBP family intramembrane metalloprotease [Bacteroidota bacterium]
MEGYQEKPVWFVLLSVVLSAGVGMVVGSGVGALLGSMIYQGDHNFFQAIQNSSGENLSTPLLVMQGVVSLFSFLLFPFLTLRIFRNGQSNYFIKKPFFLFSIPMVLGLVLMFTIADSVVIEWNQNIKFPEFLKAFEDWARLKEDELAALTKMFTDFHSPVEFITAIIVVGVLAGICEEFLFRGIIQNEFYRGTKNIHVAIWASAFLFSAIHVQFFGFVPRMLLGALFGYLYYWSGNIAVPMFAHFTNNSFSVVMIYLRQLGVIDIDIDSPDAAPWPAAIFSALLGAALLYYFKLFFDKKRTQPDGQ